ncbi:hypothetical protein [Nostocoides jenkinsii]|jgi:protein subunit release factor A|uniref:Thiamine-binding protein domain-containing protein n=1 Tax=Nostocoides jenkinsii Ben 74 TaxID=1193518 RepID=A0A077MF51_9MICO|nr:hypothetical protein [Tetrasphaera jenkinsii]CCI53767.1 hypothetical protein BN13_470013 [Tetrasphaera jenkinsii Ben 74]
MTATLHLEVHPGDGGLDAESFAAQLADAIAVYANGTVTTAGRVLHVHCL